MAPTIQNPEVENITLSFHSCRKDHTAFGYKVCVIVPVRNEAEHLYQTLDALKNQVALDHSALPENMYEVLVLVNNSSDESFQIAQRYAESFPDFAMSVADIHLGKDQAHIGTVRRLLMDEAYKRLTRYPRLRGIIASTDGDTIVDCQWVAQIVAEIEKGNDAVGGRILTRQERGNGRAYHLRDVTYRCLLAQAECILDPQVHNPYPCHHQYFGANLAVTAHMYAQAGRLPVVPFLEDVAFRSALVDQDAKIRHSFDVKVYTSSRQDGRVDVGFSEQLRRWQQEEKLYQTQMVEDVQVQLDMFRARRFLRKMWCSYQQSGALSLQDLEKAASMLKTDWDMLKTQMASAGYFGQLWHAVLQTNVESHQSEMKYQPIKQAILQLREFVRNPVVNAFQMSPAGKSRPVRYAKV